MVPFVFFCLWIREIRFLIKNVLLTILFHTSFLFLSLYKYTGVCIYINIYKHFCDTNKQHESKLNHIKCGDLQTWHCIGTVCWQAYSFYGIAQVPALCGLPHSCTLPLLLCTKIHFSGYSFLLLLRSLMKEVWVDKFASIRKAVISTVPWDWKFWCW